MKRAWPAASAGELLSLEVSAEDEGPIRLRAVHLGAPIGDQARESLQKTASASLDREALLEDVAIPATVLARDQGDLVFIAAVSDAIHASALVPELSVCVVRPGADEGENPAPASDEELAKALDQLLSGRSQVEVAPGPDWQVRVVAGPCPNAEPAPTPAPSASSTP